MKKVFLVRHAKSSWQYEDIEDYDRPLKGRGIRDAHLVSQWLSKEFVAPGLLVSSPATRALHTAMIFARTLGYPFKSIAVEDGLYLQSVDRVLNLLREMDDAHSEIMLFGHNPTFTDLVNLCVEQRINNVPTAGVICLSFNCNSWRDLQSIAELLYFDYPKNRRNGA